MKKINTPIILIVLILLILSTFNFIKQSLATEENILVRELLETESLETFWQIMMAEENKEAVLTFTVEEIHILTEKVNVLYNSIENPTVDDTDYKDMLLETFTILLPDGCPECGEIDGHKSECSKNIQMLPADGLTISTNTTISATTISGTNTVWTFSQDVTATLSGTITIPNGKTLTINGPGIIKRNTSSDMFLVKQGGTLIVNNATINGNNLTASGAAIHLDVPNNSYPSRVGKLTLNSATIKDCNRTSGMGGAIKFGDDNSYTNIVECNIIDTIIDNCDAQQGSAIMMHTNCGGNITIKNSTITNCDATYSYAGTIRTQGNANCKLQIESCNITNNTSVNNGGGVYWNARGSDAYLTITGTADNPTIISNNTAKNGGGVFLSGQSISIENTHIKGNSANYGAGICMQPYDYSGASSGVGCSLTLGTGAKVLNNTAVEYGGGIYMQIDSGSTTDGEEFSINIGSDASIQGNSANYGGAFAVTQKTGNAEYSGGASRKYDAYININGGTIGGVIDTEMNKATLDGGAFYISREYGNDGAGYDLEVNITEGLILGNKAERNGGAMYVTDNATNSNAQINVSGGTIGSSENNVGNTAINGGAIYVLGGNFAMSGGTLTNNNATENGGAVYVSNGKYTMSGGLVDNNVAKNGGSAYVIGGTYTLSGGLISNNTAEINGGAAYVDNGNFEMSGGTMGGSKTAGNTALNGGALYIVGGNFLMESGDMTYNSADNEGGAVFVNGGNIIIGIEDCTEEVTKHKSPNTHPNVKNNTATYGGGGFMTYGILTMHCGILKENQSNNEGTGNNIYMNGGSLNLNGGTIGEETNPGVVLVGGELNDTREDDGTHSEEITMIYHSGLDNVINYEINVTAGKYINIPAAQSGWTKNGYTLVGWTIDENTTVRTFDDYRSVGIAVKVEDTDKDGKINYYAVWAKTIGSITYELNGGIVTGTNATSYNYSVISETIKLNSPEKQDFIFVGWKLTASEETITNWETNYSENENSVFYEVSDPAKGLQLNIGTHFGDITLTAVYKSKEANIEIILNNAKNANYIFEITGSPKDGTEFKPLKVTVPCNQDGNGRIIIKGIPLGTYLINMKNNWIWRYDEIRTNVDIENEGETYTITFKEFNIKNNFWLNAYNYYTKIINI